MKTLTGAAGADADASVEDCFALLVAFAEYPTWYPEVVQAVEVLETGPDGLASRARAKLHVAHGPIVKDFDLLFAITAQPAEQVSLTRVPAHTGDEQRFDVRWTLAPGARTSISLALTADLSVPRLLPLGDVGDAIARGFLDAALAELAR